MTDGVHTVLDPGRLEGLLAGGCDADRAAQQVADLVEQAGAPDNYSVVVIDVA